MKTLSLITVPNPLKEQGTAIYDYIGQFVTNGTTDIDSFCEKIAKGRPNIDAPLVKLVLQIAFAVIADGIAEDNVRYNLDGISFETAISGSVPSVDASLTAENELYVLVSVGDPIRSAMSVLTANNVDASVVAVSVLAEEDSVTHVKGLVNGVERAVVTGRNISACRTGESIYLADIDTMAVKSIGTVVSEDGIGQRTDVKFAAPFAAGDYWLVLATHGYSTPDAEVATYRIGVTATEAVAIPRLTKAKQGTHADNNLCFGSASEYAVEITCENLEGGLLATDQLKLEGCPTTATGTDWTANQSLMGYVTASTATSITLGMGFTNDSAKPDGDWLDKNAQISLIRDGNTYPLLIKMIGA